MWTSQDTHRTVTGLPKTLLRPRPRMIVAAALLGFSCAASAQILVDGDFESGKYPSGWRASGNDPVISSESTCRGKHASKFVLDYYKSSVSYRTEFTLGSVMSFRHGTEYWMGFAIYLTDGWENDDSSDTLMQLHSRPDDGENYRNPSLAFSTDNGKWQLVRRWDSSKITDGKNYDGTRKSTLGSFATGRWTEFVMNFKYTYDGSGWLTVWQDGKKVMDRDQAGMAYNDEGGGYLKTGIYKPNWKPNDWGTGPSGTSRRVHYLDQLRVTDGSGSYETVAPGCGQVSPTPEEPVSPSAPAAPKGLRLSIE